MNFVKLFFKGVIIGIAIIPPGLSGGTMAVVMNVFDPLIDAVNNIFRDFKKHFMFLLPIGLGAVLTTFLSSKAMEFCMNNYSMPTYYFFAGLVAGSIPLIYKEAKGEGRVNIIAFFAGVLVVYLMSLIETQNNEVKALTLQTLPFMFLSGILGSASMIMPGLSGSVILILMGYYNTFISAISNINIPVLAVAAVGAVAGVFLVSKFIAVLFEKARVTAYSAILGLICASFVPLVAGSDTYVSGSSGSPLVIGFSVVLLILGVFMAYKMS